MSSDKDKNKKKGKDSLRKDPEPGNVSEPGGVYQPQGSPTFEKVWLMFQETGRLMKEQSRETERLMKEQSLETERLIKEQSLEADKRFRKTERIVRDVSKNIGGLNNTVGEVAEEYFRGAFSKLGELSGVKVKSLDSLQRTVGKVTGQFDIVVFGDTANILVEVKHKLREQDVIRFFERTFPAFKRLYPEHCKVKLFGAVAGMTIDDDALTQALDQGLLVFAQSGQRIVQLNPDGFQPKEF